jgi:hypothetical protein
MEKFKIIRSFYNIFKRKELQHNLVPYKQYGITKNYFSTVSAADFRNIEAEKNWLDVGDSCVALPQNELFRKLEQHIQDGLLNWSEKGYAIIEDLFSTTDIDQINRVVDDLIDKKKAKWKFQNRIMNAAAESPFLLSIALNDKLTTILELLLGRPVRLYQTMNFIKGSEQRPHTDSISVTTFPLGNVIAVWLALEDMSLENGPFYFYPGSHKLAYVMNEDLGNKGTRFTIGNKSHTDYENKFLGIIAEHSLKKEIFLGKKGSLMIWHANLIHGGEPLVDKSRTRKSMVCHYVAKNVVCYHELIQAPMSLKDFSNNREVSSNK